MKRRILAPVLCLSAACRSPSPVTSNPKAEFAPNGVPINWGSLQTQSDLQPAAEARLGNAVARRLNEAAQLTSLISGLPVDVKVVDGITSVPVKMLANDDDDHNHPYGDGQKNATIGWIGWPSQNSDPPLIMTLAKAETSDSEFRMLIIEPSAAMIQLTVGGTPAALSAELSNEQGEKFLFPLKMDERRAIYRAVLTIGEVNGDFGGTAEYPAEMRSAPAWLAGLSDHWAWPRMKVRFFSGPQPTDERYWPVLFRFPSQAAASAQASLPPEASTLAGRPISLPPYHAQTGPTAAATLKSWFDGQPPSAKTADFFAAVGGSGVHHQFKHASGMVARTAVGGVDTYVVKSRAGNNQVLYTCFDARNPEAEGQWGVPSGAGWHSIGHGLAGQPQENWTFAETVVNSFEQTGIFAGWGVRTPYPLEQPAPFEAKDVVTFRVLRPNEAYTTAKGHFHWYAVDASQKVCTVIWKHLGCALISDQELRCQGS